jgi:transcriptional regulator with XRE-family HTH domain
MHTAIALKDAPFVGVATVRSRLDEDVRARTRVTGCAPVPNVVHVRTRDWPEQEAFLGQLDQLKKRHRITYDSALAELAGISHTAISNWRNGKQKPSATLISRIAEAVKEPAHPLLVAAGLIEGATAEINPIGDLPPALQRLITIYRSSDSAVRDRVLDQAAFVVEWAENRDRDAQKEKRSS